MTPSVRTLQGSKTKGFQGSTPLCPRGSNTRGFSKYIRKDKAAVEQACLTNYSNAVMKGTVNKIKAVKRSF